MTGGVLVSSTNYLSHVVTTPKHYDPGSMPYNDNIHYLPFSLSSRDSDSRSRSTKVNTPFDSLCLGDGADSAAGVKVVHDDRHLHRDLDLDITLLGKRSVRFVPRDGD